MYYLETCVAAGFYRVDRGDKLKNLSEEEWILKF